MAVTGLGIISCLGNDLDTVASALRSATSGIRHVQEYADLGLRSCVAGIPDIGHEPAVDRKLRRFMGDAALYAYHAARYALQDAGLAATDIATPRTGIVVGSGVGSPYEHSLAVDMLRTKGITKVPPYSVPRIMGSTASACLSTAFGIRGVSYSISSACATSAHCIGHGADLIRSGHQDIIIAGGSEEICWTTTMPFDAMSALSTRNDSTASRPYDVNRDGFVIAGGAGILVLEDWARARARGARIHAELAGYGACSDGLDMVSPAAEGAARAMHLALDDAGPCAIDYINTHATSTQIGDLSELAAIREVFKHSIPLISSTKGLTGHPIAAAAAHEAIYALLMLNRGFVAGCAHIDQLDPACAELPIVTKSTARQLDCVMSNSFGFGGTNACLVFRRADLSPD